MELARLIEIKPVCLATKGSLRISRYIERDKRGGGGYFVLFFPFFSREMSESAAFLAGELGSRTWRREQVQRVLLGNIGENI